MSNPIYLRGQGKLKIAIRDSSGNITGYTQVGNVSSLKLDPKVTFIEHREDYTGYRLMDLMIPDTNSLGVMFDLEVANAYNLALALGGTSSTTSASTTFTGVQINPTITGVDVVFGPAGSTVTAITDSTSGSPKTLVAGTDYVANTDGTVTINNITGYVMPLNVSGTTPALSAVSILSSPAREISVIFEGLNTANYRKPVVISISRLVMNPAKSFDVIGKDIVKFEMDGQALSDANQIGTGVLQGYGKVQLVS